MSKEENEHREERYRPEAGSYHQATNVVADDWLPRIVESLGASHGLVLLTVKRLVIGFGYRVRRLAVAKVAKKSGLGRNRVGEILTDLEATGVISLEGRGRGRKPFLEVNLDQTLSEESVAAAARVQSDRVKRKRPPAEDDMPSPEGNFASGDLPTPDNNLIAHPGGQSAQNQLPSVVSNDLPSLVGNKINIDKKAVSRGQPLPLFSLEELGLGSLDKKERKKRNPPPPLSKSGKERTTSTISESSETNFKLGSQAQDLSLIEGSEDIPEDWRHLDALKDSIPPDSVSSIAESFAEKHAGNLKLRKKRSDLAKVVEWVIQSWGPESVVYLEDKAVWCATKVGSQKVLHPWPYFLASVVEEISDAISFGVDVSPEGQRKDDIDEAVDLLCRIRNFVDYEERVEAVIEAHYDDVTSEENLRDVILEYSGFVKAEGGVENPEAAARHLDQYLGSYPP